MASRFWVGGTGTWDASDTTHWASSSGGAGGQSVPGSSDTVTLDGNSGGGTVTVNTNFSVTSVTMSAFTGTLDFATNNNSPTMQTFTCNTGGTKTLSMGNGTWTITGTGAVFTIGDTGLTLNANSSVIHINGTTASVRTVALGSKTYSTLIVDANTGGGTTAIGTTNSGTATVPTLTVTAPNNIIFGTGLTHTIVSTTVTMSGSSGSEIGINVSGTSNLSVASGSPTFTWIASRGMVYNGGATFAATSSFDLGANSGITITAPSGGSVTGVIGS